MQERLAEYQAELMAKLEKAQAELEAEEAARPDVLLSKAGIRPRQPTTGAATTPPMAREEGS